MSGPGGCSALKRLHKDYLQLKREPLPYIHAEPLPNNFLEWHYLLHGPEKSVYCGGIYHGRIVFTDRFPYRPPAIYMITPNGRFKPNARICLSISDFHPDTWNPTWSVGSILQGILSFMLEDVHTLGAIYSTPKEKRKLAHKSLEYNVKNKIIGELFPQVYEQMKDALIIREIQNELRAFCESHPPCPLADK